MDCLKADCIYFVKNPSDGIWCKKNIELYLRIKYGDLCGYSEPTDYSFTDSSICGDYKKIEKKKK